MQESVSAKPSMAIAVRIAFVFNDVYRQAVGFALPLPLQYAPLVSAAKHSIAFKV